MIEPTRRNFLAMGAATVVVSATGGPPKLRGALRFQDLGEFVEVIAVEGNAIRVIGRSETYQMVDFPAVPLTGDVVFIGPVPDRPDLGIVAQPVIAWASARVSEADLLNDATIVSSDKKKRWRLRPATEVPTETKDRLKQTSGSQQPVVVAQLSASERSAEHAHDAISVRLAI